jgi:hypothetical protein
MQMTKKRKTEKGTKWNKKKEIGKNRSKLILMTKKEKKSIMEIRKQKTIEAINSIYIIDNKMKKRTKMMKKSDIKFNINVKCKNKMMEMTNKCRENKKKMVSFDKTKV